MGIPTIVPEPENRIEHTKKPFWVSDGLLLAIIPILVYGLLFTHESNYLGYFKVSYNYINFEWSEVFVFSSLLIGIIYSGMVLMNIPLMFTFKFRSKAARLRFLLFLLLVVYAFVLGYFGFQLPSKGLGYFGVGAGIFIIILVLYLVTSTKKKGGFQERLEQFLLNINFENEVETIWDFLIGKIGITLSFIVLIYFFIFQIVSIAGTSNAYKQKEFSIIKTTPECAVVYTKANSLICVVFDRNSKEFIPGYKIYMNEDLKGVLIAHENIGPLKPKPTATPPPLPTNTPTVTPVPTETPVPTLTSTP